jgi:Tfp pilus assembly protein PilX
VRISAFVLAAAMLVAAAGAAFAEGGCANWIATASKSKEATVAQSQAQPNQSRPAPES